MTRPHAPKSLHDKIVAACQAVGPIAKNGDNEKYAYRKASDVAAAFRKQLFKRGVLLIPDEQECLQSKLQTNGGTVVLTEVQLKTAFVLTDGKEEKRYTAFGAARDEEDKALYKAKTGALKYFLTELGLIPDENSDPEFQKKSDDATAQDDKPSAKRNKGQKTVRVFEISAFGDACERSGKSPDDVAAFLNAQGVSRIQQLPQTNFQSALKWARSKGAAHDGRTRAETPRHAEPDLHRLGSGERNDHRRTGVPAERGAEPRPTPTTDEQATAIIVAGALAGGYLSPLPDRKPQEIVRVMDEIPEFKLRGY